MKILTSEIFAKTTKSLSTHDGDAEDNVDIDTLKALQLLISIPTTC